LFIGWSCGGEHYLCIFLTWVDAIGNVQKRLVGFAVADIPEDDEEAEEFGFAAEDLGDIIAKVLLRLGRNFESVEFLSGDNTAVNPRLANLITAFLATKNIIRTIPLVGCAAHRLNLGVQQFFQPTTATYHDHVYMVNKLMVSLGTLKNRARLQAVTPLAPVGREYETLLDAFKRLILF